MKPLLTLLMAVLIAGFGASYGFADPETDTGSSTDAAALQGVSGADKAIYLNVHSGKEIVASAKVLHTDAAGDTEAGDADTHPLEFVTSGV